MNPSRERDVTAAFVRIASSLATGYDVADLLTTLTSDCARLLDVAAAGLLLADGQGVLHLMAASSQRTHDLEILQLQRAQGPCLDCYHAGTPVSVPDLDQELARWPTFVPAAQSAGFASVHALPLRFQDDSLGALGLFGVDAGALNADDLSLGQALADVASVALVQDKSLAHSFTITDRLQAALSTRVVLEQAKGVIARRGGLDMMQAFEVLRRYAHDHDERLMSVARAVVTRSLDPRVVLAHHRSAGTLRA